jgi:hypothetical protein
MKRNETHEDATMTVSASAGVPVSSQPGCRFSARESARVADSHLICRAVAEVSVLSGGLALSQGSLRRDGRISAVGHGVTCRSQTVAGDGAWLSVCAAEIASRPWPYCRQRLKTGTPDPGTRGN